MHPEQISRQAFQALWTGGLLRFPKINAALICFSLVAREHKIELTRERLLHEYNLSTEEILQDTLLRMAKRSLGTLPIFPGCTALHLFGRDRWELWPMVSTGLGCFYFFTSSTRRFFARPSSESLEAAGASIPTP